MTKEDFLISIRDKLAEVSVYSCDIETVDLSRNTRITAIIFARRIDGEDEGWVLYTKDYPVGLISRIFDPIFRDKSKICVYHNAKFDVPRLNRHGIYIKSRLADTMVMAWLLDEDRIRHGGYGLKHCTKKYLGHTMSSYEDAQSLFGDFTQYALEDALYTLKLYYLFYELLFSNSPKLEQWFLNYEMPTTQVLIDVEMRGSCLDPPCLKEVQTDILSKLDKLEKEIYKEVGHQFDIGSPKQCARVLFRSGNSCSEFFAADSDVIDESLAERFSSIGKSGDYSTSNQVLKAMSYEDIKLASLILKFREFNTRLNTFVRPSLNRCKVSNIIYPKFFQTTKSGRLRSRDPNYQNLPRTGGIRKSFVARPGYKIVKADYCVTGDTRIETDRGTLVITDVVPGDNELIGLGLSSKKYLKVATSKNINIKIGKHMNLGFQVNL
jgi:DNA polymerase-1